MDHFQKIYAQHADQYQLLVSREDYQGNLLRALGEVHRLKRANVVEFGAGTGRLTLLLAPLVRSIRAYDASAHMLDITRARVQAGGFTNVTVDVADNRALPVDFGSADLAIEGWSFGHACGWYPDTWRQEVGAMLAEMRRVLRPGGTAVILETLGTGRETPQPPTPALAELYAWLESEHEFTRQSLRTDYRFESLNEAEDIVRFFFGDELAAEVVANKWVKLPECTGLWWRRY
jgi:ubiquinone/menaquinone biosynthesis C-methylase UbiE